MWLLLLLQHPFIPPYAIVHPTYSCIHICIHWIKQFFLIPILFFHQIDFIWVSIGVTAWRMQNHRGHYRLHRSFIVHFVFFFLLITFCYYNNYTRPILNCETIRVRIYFYKFFSDIFYVAISITCTAYIRGQRHNMRVNNWQWMQYAVYDISLSDMQWQCARHALFDMCMT